jgi:cysteine desulfurase
MTTPTRQILYFDNNATTQVSPSVFEAMVPYLTEHYGNPSSAYRLGRTTAEAIEKAREQIASLLGCKAREIVFTSCGTESDNAAIASALKTTGHRHVLVSSVEHSAIKNQCEDLELQGYAVTYLPVKEDGTLTVDQVEKALRPDTAIVSLMWANNETGVLFPVEEIGGLCRERGILFHTDAVQAVGKIPIHLNELNIDFLSVSGHKLHAPKGVGVLYVRRGVPFTPFLIGGSQEKKKRGGTENTASIIALGQAAEEAREHIATEAVTVRQLRDRLENGILNSIPGTTVNGHREQRLPNTTSIAFDGVEAEALLILLDTLGVCASAGSACTTGSPTPSHVLRGMGLPLERTLGSLRLSLSRFNTVAEVDQVLEFLPGIVERLRRESPKAQDLKKELEKLSA